MYIRDEYIIEESCGVLNSGETIESEIEKNDLDLLVDALDKDLDYFFDNEEFANDVGDAVDEIEIRPEYARKHVNRKVVLPAIYVQNMNKN